MSNQDSKSLIEAFNTLVIASRSYKGSADEHEQIKKSGELLGDFLKRVLTEEEKEVKQEKKENVTKMAKKKEK